MASTPATPHSRDDRMKDDEEEDMEAGDRNQSCFKCSSKGNIFVCCECIIDEDDVVMPFQTERTKLRWVVGPYWNMLCMTYAVVITITILVYETVIPRREASEIAVGLTLSAMTLLFLSLTAFSDPGIFPKHTRPKVHSLLQPGTYVCGVAVALSLT